MPIKLTPEEFITSLMNRESTNRSKVKRGVDSELYQKRRPQTIFDYVGVQFGRLTGIAIVGHYKNGEAMVECKCECGNLHKVRMTHLKNGSVKSCGCAQYGKPNSKMSQGTTNAFNETFRKLREGYVESALTNQSATLDAFDKPAIINEPVVSESITPTIPDDIDFMLENMGPMRDQEWAVDSWLLNHIRITMVSFMGGNYLKVIPNSAFYVAPPKPKRSVGRPRKYRV